MFYLLILQISALKHGGKWHMTTSYYHYTPFDFFLYLGMAFNGRFLMNMAFLASRNGANINDLVAITGKSFDELSEETCVVDNLTYNAVIELAVQETKDEFFGLHAGENLNLAAAGLIVQLAQTSETIKQAIELCCEFANLGCSALPMKLSKKEHYEIILTPDELWKNQSQIAFQHTAEGVIAFTIKEFHSLTRMKHYPIAVHLPWSRPSNIMEYERVFGCKVHFNKDEIAILLDKKFVDQPVVTSNYNLLNILVSHAQEKSAAINNSLGFSSIVKHSLINLIKPEFPSIDQVAGHLNISTRTLQRKLKEEGTTFKQIINDLRLDFAKSYLKQQELQISEIAYLLSYSDASAFNRSFKSWTGKTPNEYRMAINS